MKLNLEETPENARHRVSDFLHPIFNKMLLESLISKSIAETSTEFLLHLKTENDSRKTITSCIVLYLSSMFC
jgi:hypothetical protein